ncbi:MAG: hypothetical protein ACRD8W_00315 [Nitrososphaeraceae archaeon]
MNYADVVIMLRDGNKIDEVRADPETFSGNVIGYNILDNMISICS